MSKKNQAIYSLLALVTCLSSSQMFAGALPEETMIEQDYSLKIGGGISSTSIRSFDTSSGQAGFGALVGQTTFGTVGITAFDRFDLSGMLGTSHLAATIQYQVTSQGSSTSLSLETDSAMTFGLSLVGTLYQEGLVSAYVFGEYTQTNLPVCSMRGFLDFSNFSLIPSYNTATPPKKLGYMLIPTDQLGSSEYAVPTLTGTTDTIFLSTPHLAVSPKCNIDLYKYDVGAAISYGQQIEVFLGLKYTYYGISLNCEEKNVLSMSGEKINGTLLDALLGTGTELVKISSSLSSNFAPIIGFAMNSKCASVSFCASFFAENTYKVDASICF